MGVRRDSSPHPGLNPFQHELALAGWKGEDSRNGNGFRKHLEVSVDGTNWQGWRLEQNWPLLHAVTFSMVLSVNYELPETGLCLVFACVLRCPRLVSVVSWL